MGTGQIRRVSRSAIRLQSGRIITLCFEHSIGDGQMNGGEGGGPVRRRDVWADCLQEKVRMHSQVFAIRRMEF